MWEEKDHTEWKAEKEGIQPGIVIDMQRFMVAKNSPKNAVQIEALNLWLKLCLTYCQKFRLI